MQNSLRDGQRKGAKAVPEQGMGNSTSKLNLTSQQGLASHCLTYHFTKVYLESYFEIANLRNVQCSLTK